MSFLNGAVWGLLLLYSIYLEPVFKAVGQGLITDWVRIKWIINRHEGGAITYLQWIKGF